MIDRNLLRYPEQMAARLTKIENELRKAQQDIKELKRKVRE